MNYATIKYYDIANGPGVRTSVFVSGCRHHCPGCFNAVAWDFHYGQPFDKATRNEVFASCQPDYIADGEFVQAKHDISLRFRGSSNQRLLDVKKTLAAGEPVWWEDEKVFATHTMEK